MLDVYDLLEHDGRANGKQSMRLPAIAANTAGCEENVFISV